MGIRKLIGRGADRDRESVWYSMVYGMMYGV